VAKHDIVRAGAPVLRARAAEVEPAEIGSKAMRDLIRTMVESMRRAPGVGLAAPQIGVSKRVIVLEDAERLMTGLSPEIRADRARVPFALKTIINPVLERLPAEGDAPEPTFFEGCLSVPGMGALVSRSLEVIVRGLSEKGEPLEWRVSGWPARILQHEVDHLDGTLYIDRMVSRTFGHNDEIASFAGGLPISGVRELYRA
jgi:peptide deformylase